MARKIIAGTYKFVDAPEKLLQFTRETNILFEDNNGTLINYATDLLPGISTDKFVLAVERPNETQKFLVYAFEDTTAGGALSVSKGWYWFNESSISLDAIPTPSVVFSDNCSINDELTTPEANALFTTSPIQVQPTVTTTRVLYKGKKELTMAQFEALTNLDDAVDYDIIDFPNGSITNAQMTAALGYSRLFEDGEIYVCSDNGTYTKGNLYQIKVEGGVKSWEDITKGLKIYPITDILNHDGIKSGAFTEEQMNNIKLADILQVYAIDGYPVSKYAYKGLLPTNSAQSTINANLYFAVATEKGNYVLAIDMTTRNWEVREPVSVQPLYKHELVIPYSFSVGDSETVDGSVTYHYLSNTRTQITSASEIDDNFLLSGGVGKNSANTAASQSESTALTWQLNDTLTLFGMETKQFDINFISNNQSFKAMYFTLGASPIMRYLTDVDSQSGITPYSENFKWMGEDDTDHSAFRTITFETAPSGELLTWLQANAVPQGGASQTTVLLLNVNVTKAGSSITVEAVNASTMGYITGTVGTITDTVTQLI